MSSNYDFLISFRLHTQVWGNSKTQQSFVQSCKYKKIEREFSPPTISQLCVCHCAFLPPPWNEASPVVYSVIFFPLFCVVLSFIILRYSLLLRFVSDNVTCQWKANTRSRAGASIVVHYCLFAQTSIFECRWHLLIIFIITFHLSSKPHFVHIGKFSLLTAEEWQKAVALQKRLRTNRVNCATGHQRGTSQPKSSFILRAWWW